MENKLLCNSEKSTDTWGFDVHLVIVNQTDEATSYRNCTIVAISNIDSIIIPGGAYTGMGWDELRQAYGEDFVQDNRLIFDGTGDEKKKHHARTHRLRIG